MSLDITQVCRQLDIDIRRMNVAYEDEFCELCEQHYKAVIVIIAGKETYICKQCEAYHVEVDN